MRTLGKCCPGISRSDLELVLDQHYITLHYHSNYKTPYYYLLDLKYIACIRHVVVRLPVTLHAKTAQHPGIPNMTDICSGIQLHGGLISAGSTYAL